MSFLFVCFFKKKQLFCWLYGQSYTISQEDDANFRLQTHNPANVNFLWLLAESELSKEIFRNFCTFPAEAEFKNRKYFLFHFNDFRLTFLQFHAFKFNKQTRISDVWLPCASIYFTPPSPSPFSQLNFIYLWNYLIQLKTV